MKIDHHVNELLQLIQLEQLEVNLFRGASRDIGTNRVFGGQVLAQALLAASHTVDDRPVHSLHAYFLRPGDPDAPIVYDVDRSRDGRSFTARRVVATQHGRQIFTLAASFQQPQEGVEHQFEMPAVPTPDELEDQVEVSEEALADAPQKLRRWFDRFGPFEFRPVITQDLANPQPGPPYQQLWFRLGGKLDVDQMMHRTLLAYVSDFHLVGTATLPHGLSYLTHRLVMASLDHAMWFHRDCRVDEWQLYDCDSPSASGSRGLARGSIYNQAGELVASVAQEGMIRVAGKRETDGGKNDGE